MIHPVNVVKNIPCVQILGSGGTRPVTSRSHCVDGQVLDILCEPVIILNASL